MTIIIGDFSYEHTTYCIFTLARGAHLVAFLWEGGVGYPLWIRFNIKNDSHHIILALDSIALKSSGLLTIYFFENQSNSRQKFGKSEIELGARS